MYASLNPPTTLKTTVPKATIAATTGPIGGGSDNAEVASPNPVPRVCVAPPIAAPATALDSSLFPSASLMADPAPAIPTAIAAILLCSVFIKALGSLASLLAALAFLATDLAAAAF